MIGSQSVDFKQMTGSLYKLCVSAVICLSLLVVAGIWHLGSNSMIACGFAGAFLIHLGTRPSRRLVLCAVLVGAGFAICYLVLGGKFGPDILTAALGVGAFLGVGSIVVMSGEIVWSGFKERRDALRDALVLPVFSLVAGLLMQQTNTSSHPSYDYLVYAFDWSLGISPEFAAVTLFRKAPWIGATASIIYRGLLIFPPLYHGWALYRGRARRINLMHAFALAGVAGFALYQICPAMGPLYAFGDRFPDHLPGADTIPLKAFSSTGVNNAMPSMHMTWALLVWWSAWELGPWAVAVASAFVMFTGLATLGFGEHYLVDLIVSVPVAMTVAGICVGRYGLAAAGLALSVAWTVFLRTGGGMSLPGPANWFLIGATLFIAGYSMRRWRSMEREWSRIPSLQPWPPT